MPIICHLQAGSPEKLVVYFQVQTWRPEEQEPLMSKGKRWWLSKFKQRVNSVFFHRFILSRPSMSWMMPTHISEGELPIHMVIPSGNTLTDTLRNNVLPPIWISLTPVKLAHKISYHNDYTKSSKFPIPSLIHQYLRRSCVHKMNYKEIELFHS